MTSPETPARLLLFDTNCFIYLFEGDRTPIGRYLGSLLREAGDGAIAIVTSTICLSEFLVGVARTGSDRDVARMTNAFLGLPGLEVAPVTSEVARLAAQLRARTSMRLFDAVIAATGHATGASELVTNDAVLARAAHGLIGTYLSDVAT